MQRIDTKVGVAPMSTQEARVGEVKTSPYTTHYPFFVPETNH